MFNNDRAGARIVDARPRPETVRSCLRVILNGEWEHLRYAVRDLDAIEAGQAG